MQDEAVPNRICIFYRKSPISKDLDKKLVFEFKQKDCVYDQQPGRMIILRDISDICRLEYARSLEKVSEIMVATTSHDMRTPLNTIVHMHKLIEQQMDNRDSSSGKGRNIK